MNDRHPISSAVLAATFAALVVASPATAELLDVRIEGDTATAEISLPGGIAAELTVAFENAVGLSEANLGLDAQLVSPTSLALLSRLPELASIPAAFPVLVTIEPPANGGLSFSGVVSVGLYTHDLAYTAGTPLRLFSAPAGGSFRDVTDQISSGSYRVRGSKGDFSQFLIVADVRPVDTVIGIKLGQLESLLADHRSAIDPTLVAALDASLADARSAWQSGETVASLVSVESFLRDLAKASAAEVPNVWRSSRDLDNVAGLLRAAGETLHFSLALKRNNL